MVEEEGREGINGYIHFLCYVTNDHKVDGLVYSTYLLSHHSVTEVQTELSWVFCSDYHKDELKVSRRKEGWAEVLSEP